MNECPFPVPVPSPSVRSQSAAPWCLLIGTSSAKFPKQKKKKNAPPFTCKYRNTAPSQREITFVFSHMCGSPRLGPSIRDRSRQPTRGRLAYKQKARLANRLLDEQSCGKGSLQKGERQFLAHLGGNFWFIVFLSKVMAFQSCQKPPGEHCRSERGFQF